MGRGDIPPRIHVGPHTSNDASITSMAKVKVKSKRKGKDKFTLELATKAQREEEVHLYSFFNLGAR